MKQAVTFAPATMADADELAESMRQIDRTEIARMHGLGPQAAARLSVEVSDAAFSARCDGRLLCVFGACRTSLADAAATGWMLCTDEPERHPRAFLAHCREGFRLLSKALPDVRIFTNSVLFENDTARRWLAWSGAWFSPSDKDETGRFGGVFKQFTIDAADAGKER